jgi:hypothetical protein
MSAPAALPKPFRALGRFARTREERCELCAVTVAAQHQHLLDPRTREMLCACDGCALLFDDSGATKLKRIPRDPRKLEGLALPEQVWSQVLPVKLAFLYRSSFAGRPVAIFPSPMGATEAEVSAEHWAAILAGHPRLAGIADDVEALLVSRLGKEPETLLAPIDRCFALVGILRAKWQGINGGDEVWPEVRKYLATLREKAV